MDKFLVHNMPLAKRGMVKDVAIGEINSRDFNFKEHFAKDKIAVFGRWWVCGKSKPWSIYDVMVIDSGDDFALSFADLTKKDLQDLFDLIKVLAEYLKQQEIKKIVIGANINQFSGSCDPESIQRLHVHVCGLTDEDLSAMEPISRSDLAEKSGRDGAIFDDGLIGVFKQYFDEEEQRFEYEYCGFDHGYCFEIGNSFAELKTEKFINFILKLDKNIKDIYNKIRSGRSHEDGFLSYAFSITFEDKKLKLFMSPRSISGRGVLESLGIILSRDLAKDLSFEQYSLRDKFFKNLALSLSKEKK